MPKFLETKLKADAAKKGNKETAKGAAMQDKHMAKLKGESHSYDNRRPVKQIRSRYSK